MTARISQPIFLTVVITTAILLFLMAVAVVDASAWLPPCVWKGTCA